MPSAVAVSNKPLPPTPWQPTGASLARRQDVARIVSGLRSVRPRTPFYCLAAHRAPTLWGLYRGLLRASPGPVVRSRIQELFQKHRHLTSPALTKAQLEKGYRWLDLFHQAKRGDEHLQAVLERYERLIVARREHHRMARIVNEALAWQHRLISRPIVTGGFFKPSIYNGPLPRLKPQPAHISGMIHKRRLGRAKHVAQQRRLSSRRADMEAEAGFEDALMAAGSRFVPTFGGPRLTKWTAPLDASLKFLQGIFERDSARATRQTPPKLLRQLAAARRARDANIRRERQREWRGEVLTATRRRAKLGFPAPVLDKWTPRHRRMQLIARRSVGDAGYVGQVKRALGYKVRPEEDQVDDETRTRLNAQDEELRAINRSRRVQ
ncbi:hypothetical protein BC834DRAFT_534795 [Gloeopeniophorella convolvens]|nr:hypothetical protein BC834DRAFT_534795 [Gloeopeniophorella convolvens]